MREKKISRNQEGGQEGGCWNNLSNKREKGERRGKTKP